MKKVYTQTQILRKIADLRVEVNYLKSTIAELSFPKTEAEARIKVVTDAVEYSYGLPLGTIYRKSRVPRIAEARMMAMVLINKGMKLSLTKSAAPFQMDHSNVPNAVNEITDRTSIYPFIRKRFEQLCLQLCYTIDLQGEK